MTVTTDLFFAMRMMLDDVGREGPLHHGMVSNLLEYSLASRTVLDRL